jgi:signal transduction histidine kinase
MLVLGTLLNPGRVFDPLPVENPAAFEGSGTLSNVVGAIGAVLLVPAATVTLVGAVLRFRRARGVERQQFKWFAFAVSLLFACFLLTTLGLLGSVSYALIGVAFAGIPVSVGIAILRYRLYDIDVVIRKTVIYVILAILLVGVGLGLVAVGVATASVFSTSVNSGRFDLLIGLVVGALVWPLRRVAIRIADRIVYGGRASPYEVLSEFGDRVAGTYAADDVLERTARVLAEGVGAERARVWLSVGDGLVPVAVWSRDGVAPEAPDGLAPEAPDGYRAEVRQQGELLGALSVTMPANDPMDPSKEKLVADLAAQAGLLFRNVRLVEELRASRRRLVAAQDEERRKLERNIHDGAQQQLVALAVKARLARQLSERDPSRSGALLGEIEGETQVALDDLRDLARGIYPPLLADQGLAAAIEAQGRRSPTPVTVRAAGLGRFPPDVEAAVYFCVLEALQNVAKYAEAETAIVSLGADGGFLSFEVSDDGRGFDTGSTGTGSGLQGIGDRLAALDGSLEVLSSPGAGTRVVGRVPVPARASAEEPPTAAREVRDPEQELVR